MEHILLLKYKKLIMKKLTQKEAIQKTKNIGGILIGEYLGNHIKVEFQCPNCNIIFKKEPASIWSRKQILCPKCSIKKHGLIQSQAIKERSLGYLYPELIKLYSKNNAISIFKIYPNSHIKRKWICEEYKYKHEYMSMPNNIVSNYSRCPYCTGKKIKIGFNDLASQYPEIAKEWHPTKNGDLKPTQVMSQSNKKAWWLCSKCKYEWFTTIAHRTINNRDCPNCCPKSKGEDKIKELLIKWNVNYIYNKRFNTCKNKRSLPFDFYLKDYNLLIEFQGEQHYNKVKYFGGECKFKQLQQHDKIKKQWTKSNGYNFLIIPYWEKNNIETILMQILENIL